MARDIFIKRPYIPLNQLYNFISYRNNYAASLLANKQTPEAGWRNSSS